MILLMIKMVIILCFTPNQYANIDAVDFLRKCQDDTRAYRIMLTERVTLLYIKELKRYNGDDTYQNRKTTFLK
jgi:hypothetical protein